MSLKTRIGKLERNDDGPSGRVNICRYFEIVGGRIVPTEDDLAQMRVIETGWANAPPADSIDEELVRLIAQIPQLPPAPPVCGLRELPGSSIH